jgi:hypothetical protein
MSRLLARSQLRAPRGVTAAALAALAALAGGIAAAQPPARPSQAVGRELLNSERIAQRFGSYGLQVLESGPQFRVSNLYSGQGAQSICRTFAVVRYPDAVDPSFAAEHEAILHGGSIGAVFAAAGWHVEKAHLYFGRREASQRLAGLMHIEPGTPLAVDVYALDVVKPGVRFQYAAIVEIHHPDYLTVADLRAIYGAPDSAGREGLLQTMLDVARRKMSD